MVAQAGEDSDLSKQAVAGLGASAEAVRGRVNATVDTTVVAQLRRLNVRPHVAIAMGSAEKALRHQRMDHGRACTGIEIPEALHLRPGEMHPWEFAILSLDDAKPLVELGCVIQHGSSWVACRATVRVARG
jgi:hypothetical protein